MSAPHSRSADELNAILDAMGAYPPAGLNRYRVTVIEWLSYSILVDARSEQDAENLTAEIWCKLGSDALKFEDSGTDGYVVDLFERGVA